MISDLSGRSFGILGLGRSGVGAAGLVRRLGGTALISDLKPEACFGPILESLRAKGIVVETGSHSRLLSESFDILIVSPGAVIKPEWSDHFGRQGTIIWSELEFAAQCYGGKWIGVTGSNGKTTTVTLLKDMLKVAGLHVDAVGNIGVAWSERLPAKDVDVFVVEVSSFQLENTHSARPDVCVLLNVLENHLDRHGDLETYGNLKLKLAARQNSSDFVVYNASDGFLSRNSGGFQGRRVSFGHDANVNWLVSSNSVFKISGTSAAQVLSRDEWNLVGSHNLMNAAAAAAAADCFCISTDHMHTALVNAVAVEHRIELVRTMRGVRFVNDSKSTNLTATLTALDAIDAPVILLFGGRPKRESFAPLAAQIGKKVREIVVFGEAQAKVRAEIPETRVHFSDDLPAALAYAQTISGSGDTILLSPGCASFDQFDNYEQRGLLFKKLVQQQ